MRKLKDLQFQLVTKIFEKPEHTRTLQEESQVYWWFYHDMEDPEEWQLRMCAQRYILQKNHVKWCTFLLQRFPSKENLFLVKCLLGVGVLGSAPWKMQKVMKGVLRARPLSPLHIEFAFLHGPLSVRAKAQRIATRLYEI